MLLYTTPLCRRFSQGYRSGRAAAHALWMSGKNTPNDSIWQQTWKKHKWLQFFTNWKAQLPEWAAATVIQKQHILCVYNIYMHGIRSTCVKTLSLDFSVVQDPTQYARLGEKLCLRCGKREKKRTCPTFATEVVGVVDGNEAWWGEMCVLNPARFLHANGHLRVHRI